MAAAAQAASLGRSNDGKIFGASLALRLNWFETSQVDVRLRQVSVAGRMGCRPSPFRSVGRLFGAAITHSIGWEGSVTDPAFALRGAKGIPMATDSDWARSISRDDSLQCTVLSVVEHA